MVAVLVSTYLSISRKLQVKINRYVMHGGQTYLYAYIVRTTDTYTHKQGSKSKKHKTLN